jgi:hypothetical protein
VAASRRASAADDDARAERILVEARARYGDHRAVLLRLRAVREALGDVEGRDSVDRRLAELALAELY